jgi:hypothetical protein
MSFILAAFAPSPGSAATRQITQTLVFDAVERGSFVDQPPAGPSPGDTEFLTARLHDADGHFAGTARSTCVFTKVIPNDVLERCTASGRTSEGTLSFGGVGHLESMNPPWQVTGGTGAYKGVRGKLVFDADIRSQPDACSASPYSSSPLAMNYMRGSFRALRRTPRSSGTPIRPVTLPNGRP